MGKIDSYENEILKWETGQSNSLGTAQTPWLGLFTTLPGEDGTGGTETTVVSRANSSTKWAAPSAGSVATNADVSLGTASGDSSGYIKGIGIFDASTAGNLRRVIRCWGARKTASAATSDTITSTSHGFADGTRVLWEAPAGVSVPGGLAENTTYYVRDSVTNTLKLAATLGGSAIDITTDGVGYLRQDKSKPIFSGDPVSILSGELTITED